MAKPTTSRTSAKATRSARAGSGASAATRGAPAGTTKVSQAQAPRPLSQQYLRPGRQNPESVSVIMREADMGYTWRLCDLFENYRNLDCHLQTVVSRRERSLADVPWQMIPASEKRRDVKIAAWVEEVLKGMGDTKVMGLEVRSITDAIVHLNAGVFHGYGAGENLWQRDGKYVKPVGFLPMQPRRFIFAQEDASLRWFDVNGPLAPYPGQDLLHDYPEGRFLVHRPRINGAVGSREGLMRPLIWASLFRNWTIADWHKLAELAWKPYRVGTYKKEDSVSEDRNILEEALQLLTSEGWASIPNSVEIEQSYAKNRGAGMDGLHGGLAAFLAAEMSKVTLGATLSVEQGSVGSNALGNVHERVSHEVRDADARSVESTIQRQLIAALVRYNFGNSVPIPQFRFVTEEGADLSFLAEALKKLGPGVNGMGLAIPAQWARITFGIPEPVIGEELMNGVIRRDPAVVAAEQEEARKKMAAVAAQGGQVPPGEEDEGNDATVSEEPAKGKPAAEDEADDGPQVSDRAMARCLRNYVVDQVLTLAGMRRPANHTRIAA